jgi:hypothetical protein
MCERLFKRFNPRAEADPIAAQTGDHRINLGLPDDRSAKNQATVA